jgi:apolipoprotein N-acyltransferase
LQGNIDQGVKWSPAFADDTMRAYEELSRQAVAAGARLVVWPETAVPGAVETERGFGPRLVALARELGVVMVVGAVGVEPVGDDYRFFDSAYVFDRAGQSIDRYDKAHLVPFGEYLPLRRILGRFVSVVARGIAHDDVTPGPSPRATPLPFDPEAGGPAAPPEAVARGEVERVVRTGVPICYELLFPDLVRHFAADGGELLVAITNDAWYGRTGAPYQFLAITALRSAETRLWTARTANTGITALIDERGRVREQTPLFERTILVGDVPLRGPGDAGTFYVRHGEVFAGACWAFVAGSAILGWFRPRGERGR